jgi:hypothetical protein
MKLLDVLKNKTLRAILLFLFGVAVLFSATLMQGCASVSVNPETGEVTYFRIGNQNISGLHVRTPNGWEITFDQESKTESLKAVLNIAEALK